MTPERELRERLTEAQWLQREFQNKAHSLGDCYSIVRDRVEQLEKLLTAPPAPTPAPPTFAGHRLIQLTCNQKTDTVLCECGWQQTFISCGAAFDGWLLHYRITVENWSAEPAVPRNTNAMGEPIYRPKRKPQVEEGGKT